MAHVSNAKKKELVELEKMIRASRVIGLIDLSSYPSSHLQKLKARFRDKMEVRVSKKSIMHFAFEKAGIKGMDDMLDNGIPALVFSNQDPFILAKLMAKNKTNTFAKAGQVAPHDIIIQAGPTSFPPGPVIGEFGSAGLKTAIESGKIVIKEDKLFLKKGDIIDGKKASILSKLGIEPMEIKVRLIAMHENGNVYGSNVLDIDEASYIAEIKRAVGQAFNLAFNTCYVTNENIAFLIKKAEIEISFLEKSLSKNQNKNQNQDNVGG